MGTEEERWRGGACQGRGRIAARRSGRVAGGQDADEELERKEQERKTFTHNPTNARLRGMSAMSFKYFYFRNILKKKVRSLILVTVLTKYRMN